MRFLCVIGMIFHLIVDKSESATQAPCTTRTTEWTWVGQSQNLKTCEPNVNEAEEEDFTISSARDPMTLAFETRDKKGVKFLPNNLWSVFPGLVTVAVWNCSVTAVNENNFKKLTKLQHLNLARNKIERIASDAFVDLVSLKDLNLRNNRIQILGKHTFASLKALKELYLNNNEIQFLHPKIFRSMLEVEKIDLDDNEILSLDENIFGSMTSLLRIYLSANKLERVAMNLFKNNLKLERIWFDDNRIKFIDGSMFDHLLSLEYVDLEGNLCLNKDYWASSFGAMKEDLKENCAEVSNQEALKNLQEKLENSEKKNSDVVRQLDSKSREIKALEGKFDTMKQEILQMNVTANFERLSKDVDMVIRAVKEIVETFEG